MSERWEIQPGVRGWTARAMGEDGFWETPDPLVYTDTEVLQEILMPEKECPNPACDFKVDAGDFVDMDSYPPCPSCGGSGKVREPAEGVERVWDCYWPHPDPCDPRLPVEDRDYSHRHYRCEWVLQVPLSMLEADDD